MADPLSVTASAIAVIGAAVNVAQTIQTLIKTLRKAPDELLALSNEVSDLRLVLYEIDLAAQGQDVAYNSASAILQILHRGQAKLDELDQFVKRFIRPHLRTVTKVDRVRWVKEKNNAQAIQSELRAIRMDLATILAAKTSSGFVRLDLELKSVGTSIHEIKKDHNKFHSLYMNELEGQKQSLAKIIDQMSPSITASYRQVPMPEFDGVRETQEHLLAALSTLDTIRQGQEQTQLMFRAMAGYREGANDTHQLPTLSRVAPLTQHDHTSEIRKSKTTPLLSFQFLHMRSPCSAACSCSCHSRHRFKSPQIFHTVFGSFFIGYTGLPVANKRCDEITCQRQSKPAAEITYCFPFWFLARTISLIITQTSCGDPVACLKVRRTIPVYADIFRLASNGDVQDMKTLFEQRKASPMDVAFGDGRSALHIAINSGQIEACKILINAGADPYLEDQSGVSPIEAAWSKILSKTMDQRTLEELQSLFIDDSCLETRQFTTIHKMVLGLMQRDLSDELQVSTSTINARDAYGTTALLWATQRGDDKAVQILLRFGADPNICDIYGIAPLHYAAYCNHPSTVTLLIEKGARVNHRNKWERTALHATCGWRDELTYINPLLSAGADIDAKDYWGSSSLAVAAVEDNARVAEFLIERGANIDSEDRDGDTPLFEAIHHCSHQCLDLLLREHADYRTKNRWENTVLHMAAAFGDGRILEVLSNARLEDIDVHARNVDGYTAMEILEQRKDTPERAREGFKALVASVRGGALGSVKGKLDDGGDIFVDAVEQQVETGT